MVGWCSENARLSGLGSAPIRYVVEDAVTYLHREIRRRSRYDAIIMDPPSFGRGKNGELWKLAEHLPRLLESACEVLSEKPLFLLLNIYSDWESLVHGPGGSPRSLIERGLSRCGAGGTFEEVELGLRGSLDHRWLPCGISYRWKVT
jgi:23S rRNA (cytosine1962-C5)-methyltransferase